MFKDYTLQTTWGRALVALAGGAVVGAIGLTLVDMPYRLYVFSRDIPQIIVFWADVFFFNLRLSGIALTLIGAPIWALAHWLGFRTRASALLVGFGLSFSLDVYSMIRLFLRKEMIFNSEVSTGVFWETIFILTFIPLLGTASALTIWRIAYRRPAPC